MATLLALVSEMGDRGFAHLSDARRKVFLRRAYTEIAEQQPWPWLLASASGVAPLTVADLQTVESVVDLSVPRKLVPADVRALSDRTADLTTPGTPAYYYVEWAAGAPQVRVFPVGAGQVSVRYYRVPPTWNDGDEPLVPARYQGALTDYAVGLAHEDASEFEAAALARAAGDRLIGQMLSNVLYPQIDRPSEAQVVSGGHQDWV